MLLPVCFLAGVMNYLDRTNLTFAALQLNEDLGFTPQVCGRARAACGGVAFWRVELCSRCVRCAGVAAWETRDRRARARARCLSVRAASDSA